MKKYLLTAALGICFSHASFAEPAASPAVHELQKQWAVITYKTPADQKEKAYRELAQKAHKINSQSKSAETVIWEGIILGSLAGVEGGLGALDSVKQAKELLEQSIQMDASALNSGAYITLGTLYHKAPAWPVSFGDDEKAKKALELAVAKNPSNIDANFFYAQFLSDEGEYAKAVEYYKKALAAPDRPQRPLADQGRRQEINEALDKLQAKL